jgi:hypothetical protein
MLKNGIDKFLRTSYDVTLMTKYSGCKSSKKRLSRPLPSSPGSQECTSANLVSQDVGFDKSNFHVVSWTREIGESKKTLDALGLRNEDTINF